MSPHRKDVRDAFEQMRAEMTKPAVVANLAACRRTVEEGTGWLNRHIVFNWAYDWADIEYEYDNGIDQEEAEKPNECPGCGDHVEERWSYCPGCGEALSAPEIPFDQIVEEERKNAEYRYLKDCIAELEKVLAKEAVSA